MVRKVAIFGAAGAVGSALAPELERRGVPFRVVGRAVARLKESFGSYSHAEIFPADLADAAGAEAAARGCDTVVYAVGVPYTNFELHPKLMRITVDAASAAGVERLVVVSSVYSYGVPQTRRVAETHPRNPVAAKGRFRKEQEDIALEAHARQRIRSLVLRLPDFYGPHAENSLAGVVFRAALDGKVANWMGPVSPPHEFVFVPDAAPVLADLAGRDECFGEAWNFGGPGEISGGAFIQKVYLAAGRPPRFRSVGRTMLKLAGLFNPLMRELVEMVYLQETPVILDDSKLLARLGAVRKTSYDDGIRQTLAAYSSR